MKSRGQTTLPIPAKRTGVCGVSVTQETVARLASRNDDGLLSKWFAPLEDLDDVVLEPHPAANGVVANQNPDPLGKVEVPPPTGLVVFQLQL